MTPAPGGPSAAAYRSGARAARSRASGTPPLTLFLLALPALLLLVAFFAVPVGRNLVMSLQEYTTRTFFTGEAPFVGGSNYADVVTSSLFWSSVANTALFTVGSIALQFVVGLALAVFFDRAFPLSRTLRAALLLPWLIPLVAGSAVWRGILDQDAGILNSALGAVGVEPVGWLTSPDIALASVVLVNVWVGIPFNLVLLYSGLQDIPAELHEAAALDGANGWERFRHVTLPLLRPVVLVVLVLGVVYTLKVVDVIVALTGGGPANATQTLAVRAYQSAFIDFEFGVGAAWNVVLTGCSLLAAATYLRLESRTTT
ncbi:MAG: carbohydrate ABC transporter permease [Dermatophilaceae bacterium]